MTQNPAMDDPKPETEAQIETEGQTPDALAAAEAERDDLKDKLLRTLAEMENLRRRTEREIADAKAYAVTSFARDMLGSADNLRRAIESVPATAEAAAGSALKSVVEGVELTERELLKTLERHGVRRIEPHGEKFDQAMFEAPDESIAKGLVSKVVQTGYKIGERVLRPALVGVSAGSAKPAANGAQTPEAGDKPAGN